MIHFPPNLEDGEQWLPSDIYQEIISDSFKLEALAHNNNNNNITQECDAEIESFEHGRTRTRTRTTRVLKEQNCLYPPVHGKGEEMKGFVSSNNNNNNSGGTGVFLPQTALKKWIKGTGVFLQSFATNAAPPTIRKNKKSGKNEQGVEKMLKTKKESPRRKELSQLSTEICLPQEWTY